MRACEWCGASLEGKRSHARYCSSTCRAKASLGRREESAVCAFCGLSPALAPRLRSFADDLQASRTPTGRSAATTT